MIQLLVEVLDGAARVNKLLHCLRPKLVRPENVQRTPRAILAYHATSPPVPSCHSFASRSRDGFFRAELSFQFSSLFFLKKKTGLCKELSRKKSCDEQAVGGCAALELEPHLDRPGKTIGM